MSYFNGKVVYIAGPMTGLPECNRPAFFAAEKWLKTQGAIVLNPAHAPDGLPSHGAYMRIALAMVREAECIFLLSGFENSKGVKMELELAAEIGIPVIHYGDATAGAA